MSIEHPARKTSGFPPGDLSRNGVPAKNLDAYNQYGQYQRYRQMSLDDMLLENRIVFLIGDISYQRAAGSL